MERTIDPDRLTAVLQPLLATEQVAGCTVAVVNSHGVLYQAALGFKNIDAKAPMTVDTTFRIASITKTFTGIAILQLVEQGLLNLDRPITEFLRAYQWNHVKYSRPATLRELLTHTSGVGEVLRWSDLLTSGNVLIRPGRKRLPLANLYQGSITPDVNPGTKWAYSNHAFATLGQVIEDVSRHSYEDYLTEHILAPAQMSMTGMARHTFESSLSEGYVPNPKKKTFKAVPWLEVSVLPAGGLISTIGDMARYTRAILSDLKDNTQILLEQHTLQAMLASQWQPDSCIVSQGLAFLLGEFRGHRLVWHDGGAPGFTSSLLLLPDLDLGVVMLSNTLSGGARAMAESVLSQVVPDLTPPTDCTPDPAVQSRLLGTYGPLAGAKSNVRFWQQFGPELTITQREPGLVLSALVPALRKGVALYPINASSTCYRADVLEPHSERVVPLFLTVDARGSEPIKALSGQYDLPFQVERVPTWRRLRTWAVGAAAVGALLAFWAFRPGVCGRRGRRTSG